ncbi:MAG: hypothetical protein U9Q20_08435 [Campylobacterota bacterium]|nr:hypothetical protein [Campylobacterota bacterium]
MGMFGSIGKVFSSTRLKKREFDPEKMSIEDITLPICLRNMDIEDVESYVKNEIDTYKSLGYVNMPIDQLKFPEYHSYQVGVLLRYLKDDKVYFMPEPEKIIPSIAMHVTKRQLHIKVFDFIYRYNQSIEPSTLKQDLEHDMKWTAYEVGFLLHYLTLENRIIPKN